MTHARANTGATPRSSFGDDASALAVRMNGILEPRMRVAAMAELLAVGEATAWVRIVAELVAAAGDAGSGHRAALDAVLLVLSDDARLAYQRRAELYAAARDAELPEVALLLFDVAPPQPGTAMLERHLDEERPLVPTGRPMTLGERKSLARGHRRDLLLQLLRDPHPDVIAILLDNPRLTESDVLKLATRRPMLPDALAAVFRLDRWRVRSHVRRALVLNPYTPLPLAARLMTTLADGDLAGASGDPSLRAPLRRHAAEILARRRRAFAAPSQGASHTD